MIEMNGRTNKTTEYVYLRLRLRKVTGHTPYKNLNSRDYDIKRQLCDHAY